MVPLKAERRADLEDVAIRAGNADQDIAVAEHVHDAGCGGPVRLLRLAVAHELDADVKPLSTHIAGLAEALGDGTERPQEVGADLERVLLESLGLERLQDGEAGRGGDRVSSERVEVAGSFPEGL